jgi:hypothetical protein
MCRVLIAVEKFQRTKLRPRLLIHGVLTLSSGFICLDPTITSISG